MDAFVYLRVLPGMLGRVAAQLPGKQGVRRAVIVVGDWDLIALVDGVSMSAIAANVLAEIHSIEGIQRTLTVPLVPPDRVGMGFATPPPPALMPGDACYVHIRAQAGAVEGLIERLAEIEDVSGVAVTGGPFDLVVEIRQPWEVAAGIVLSQVQPLPGVTSTSTMVGVLYEEPDEDRDQFSAWS